MNRTSGFLSLLFCLMLVAVVSHPARAQAVPVDLELVLAVDTSTSVDEQEFELQKQGLYEAFLHPEVIDAIKSIGDLGIAVTLVQWSGTGMQKTVVDWTPVRDAASAAYLSRQIRNAPRAIWGLTDIGSVIRYSVESILGNRYEGYRRVVDISGDGSSDAGTSAFERDRAVAQNVTVNGLVIYSDDYDLGGLAKIDVREHYANHVIGGVGAFMMTADDFEDFRTAIRRKLIREIRGPATASLPRTIQ